jgi:DNA invertase Pin-like site-specific DNA recombinase
LQLRAAAERMGHQIVATFKDNGISGGLGRNGRPGFDELHKAAARREFDIILAWSVDRLGRSLQDLVDFLQHLRATSTQLYVHQSGLDTTTPAGRMLFQVLGTFAEFEKEIIAERVRSGMARAKAKGTRSGKAIGRPALDAQKKAAIRAARAADGGSLRQLAKRFHVSPETVRQVLA